MNIHSKIFFDKLLNYKSIKLCVNDRGKCRNSTKELKKCNHEYVQDYFRSKICSFPSKTFYNNSVSNISVLIGLYNVLILQLALADSENGVQTEDKRSEDSPQSQDNSDGFSFSNIPEYLQKGFQCISGNGNDENCIQKIFLVLSLAGTVLSLIGAVFSLLYRFCSCFMCCRRSPRPKSTNQVNYNNQQLDLMKMQMQQQQQQMCNALMGAALARKGKMSKGTKKKGNKKGGSEKKNRNSLNGTNKPRSKNSKDKHIHIGYQ
ncbi:hypothetical protein POVCU2_0055750 [Plasmodium ovale curtisi]|uniref:PIR Superfamily Protein n=1 Tax=Plasmodium ovale curtisi TaxID=864141 RepID=A0A1A8WC24_PLAOA|nr:hypothetical protein POVCU2_0055750 [Plasmodium ovale curtisi]SBT01818.1 hypothetical protein POVCU1_069810 [Plasmodium ovale curtisi]